jgi:NADP-dependent aldehyde dehydrogenase
VIEFTESVTGAQIIAGETSAEAGGSFHSINPRNGEKSSIAFANATPNEIDRAVQEAAGAYQETRAYPPGRLADFLDGVAGELEALGEPLFETTDIETALGRPRLPAELARTTGQLRKFGALLREGSYVQAIIDRSDSYDIRRMLIPIGPVAVFSASNFPYAFAVAGGDTASAWAAGCPVVVKGHPAHPATSEIIARAINRVVKKHSFPAGFFSLIQGASNEVGQGLVQHPLITAVGFTGSLQAGRALFNLAAARPVPIPVFAEMGSVNPLVILPGALSGRSGDLADNLFASLTLGTGQYCTNPGLVFVPAAENGQTFIQAITERMKASEPGVLLNPQIQAGLARAVTGTLHGGAVEKLAGGSTLDGDACQFEATVMVTSSAQLRQHDDLQREHFGPVVLFVTYDGIDDLIDTLKTLHGQLTATIHAADNEIDTASVVYEHLRQIAGRLIWNGFPTGVAVVGAMQHGGPYPATTAPATTSVGMAAIERFMRPVAYQSMPDGLLPDALRDSNPLGILRKVNDVYTRDAVTR